MYVYASSICPEEPLLQYIFAEENLEKKDTLKENVINTKCVLIFMRIVNKCWVIS